MPTTYRWAHAAEEDLVSDDEEDSENSDEEGSGDLVFPASYTAALTQLLEAETPVAVKEIKLGSKEEKVGLAYSLWDEGLLSTEPTGAPASSKKAKQKK